MQSFSIYLRRNSLFTSLIVAVIMLAFLAIFASIMGWLLLNQVSQSQQQLARQAIPLISAAQSLATESAATALITPQIAKINDRQNLQVIFDQLESHLKSMQSTQQQLELLTLQKSMIEQIGDEVIEISNNYSDLRRIMAGKLDLQESKYEAETHTLTGIKQLEAVIDQAIVEQSDRLFDLSDQMSNFDQSDDHATAMYRLMALSQISEDLFWLKNNAVEFESLVQSLSGLESPANINEIGTRLLFHLRTMVNQSVTLPIDETFGEISINLELLFQAVNQPLNVAALQHQLYLKSLELKEANNRMQANVHRLNELTDTLVVDAEQTAGRDTAEVSSSAKWGSNLLLLVAIISLVASVFLIWVIIVRKIVLPLIELTHLIRQLSGNQLDIKINHYAMIELNEVAKSLEVFRDNSISLAGHQKSLQETNQSLKRANEDLNAFVHVASHDLKSPLRGIHVLSDFIIDDIRNGNNREAEVNLQLLQSRIQRLSHLLDSLLAYTYAGAGAGSTQLVNVEQLIKDAFDLVNTTGKFQLSIETKIPECALVETDLTIIFLNLFNNAIGHHDHEQGLVKVSFQENDTNYLFEIEDDGPGIEPQFHEVIFEVLKTLKSKDTVEGSGVGLAQVKRLLESRRGMISVISNPEIKRGARFVVQYLKRDIEQ